MKISNQTRYAMIAMIELAQSKNSFPLALRSIAIPHGISSSYIEQIFAKLKKHQLVEGVRGPGGGYVLAKPAGNISVAEIFLAVNEENGITLQRWKANNNSEETQRANQYWLELCTQVDGFLLSLNLAQVAHVDDIDVVSGSQKVA